MTDNGHITICDWVERYEVNASGRAAQDGDKLRSGPLQYIRLRVHGYSQGLGYRKLVALAGDRTMEVFGFFCKLLELAAHQDTKARGMVRESAKDLSFVLSVPIEQVEHGIAVLSSLGWIHASSLKSASLRGASRIQTNTIQTNTNQYNTPQPPKGGAVRFDQFWAAYPRKTGKIAARKAWDRCKPVLEDVLKALAWQTVSEQWTKDGGQYVPNPATYLNQGRWMDEPPPKRETEAEEHERREREGNERRAREAAEKAAMAQEPNPF